MPAPKPHWLLRVRPMELAALLKAVLHIKRVPVTAEGASWLIDPASDFGNRLLREGTYEPGLLSAMRAVLQPGDAFIDVGANEGWFSILAANAVGPTGLVLAIEPQARLWPVIEAHIQRNDAAKLAVRQCRFACGAEQTTATITLAPSTNSGATTFRPNGRQRWGRRQVVDVQRLDALMRAHQLDTVRCLKVDVEGFERDVLNGCGDWLDGRINYLLLETHPEVLEARGDSRDAVESWLKGKGYIPERWEGIYLWRWHELPCPPRRA
jgi:FkbM family methyltransferase